MKEAWPWSFKLTRSARLETKVSATEKQTGKGQTYFLWHNPSSRG